MKLLVGGKALAKARKDKTYKGDTDYWVDDKEDLTKLQGCDYHVLPKEIIKMTRAKMKDNPEKTLFTIKLSHMGYDILWDKNFKLLMRDFRGFVNRREYDKELLIALYEYWKTVHGNKDFLSLNKGKDDFFNDYVEYVHDHDYLHELVAFPNKPVYAQCLVDNEEVLIDKDKFFTLPFSEQVRMFKEEITVIAVERWLVGTNVNPQMNFSIAYNLALRKTLTSLTKGWATLFILENLFDFILPDYDMIEYLRYKISLGGMENNKVKPTELFKELGMYDNGYMGDDEHNSMIQIACFINTYSKRDEIIVDKTRYGVVICWEGQHYWISTCELAVLESIGYDIGVAFDPSCTGIYKVEPKVKNVIMYE